MAGHPSELREQIIRDYEAGQSCEELARLYGVHPNTIRNYVKLKAQTGSVGPRPHAGGKARILSGEQLVLLRRLREQHPHAKQQELTEKLSELAGVRISRTTVSRELRALGFKRASRKAPRAKPRLVRSAEPAQTRYRQAERPQAQVTSGRKPYPSDLSDAEWALLAPLIPQAKPGGRTEDHPKREIVNAILYVLRSGCQWRMLPHDFPPNTTVYDYFRAWRDEGVWQRVNQVLREQVRMRAGRNPLPSAGIVDSQSAKTTEKGGSVDMMGRNA